MYRTRNYFIFNGKDSRDFEIQFAEYPPIVKPQRRVQSLTVPGRSGTLHIKEGKYGEDVYDSYYKHFTINALNPARIPEIKEWLDGAGVLIIGNELDWEYDAYVTSGIEFQRFFRGWHTAELTFEVQPYKKHKNSKTVEFNTATDTTILNEGSAPIEAYTIKYSTGSSIRRITINDTTVALVLTEAVDPDVVEVKDVVITMPDLYVTYSIKFQAGTNPVTGHPIYATKINCTGVRVGITSSANSDLRLLKGANTLRSYGAGSITYREMSL